MNFTGPLVLKTWNRVGRWPGGEATMSWLIGKLVPYTGTVRPRIRRLEVGLAVASIEDRRGVRNHLKSVHAIALANIAEFTGSLALVTRVPEDKRWIVIGLDIDYLKKARGRITAACDVRQLELPEEGECQADVVLTDSEGDDVVHARVRLKVSPKPPPKAK